MRTDAERHLTPEEVVGIVFPAGDGPSEVPPHLAACSACQAMVVRLREAWLLDRGAVEGAVEALPEPFWDGQRAAILRTVGGVPEAARPATSGIHPFPAAARKQSPFRHPVFAFGSLAAAVGLVAVLTVHRFGAPERSAPVPAAMVTPAVLESPAADPTDDELLLSIDRILGEDPPYTSLVPDGTT
jgi:hypothetical protein